MYTYKPHPVTCDTRMIQTTDNTWIMAGISSHKDIPGIEYRDWEPINMSRPEGIAEAEYRLMDRMRGYFQQSQEKAQSKINIALKYASSTRRIEELEWWIHFLTVIYSDPSLFTCEIKLLQKQVEEWKGENH